MEPTLQVSSRSSSSSYNFAFMGWHNSATSSSLTENEFSSIKENDAESTYPRVSTPSRNVKNNTHHAAGNAQTDPGSSSSGISSPNSSESDEDKRSETLLCDDFFIPPAFTEKTLRMIGVRKVTWKCHFPLKKKSLYRRIRHNIEQHVRTTVQIHINMTVFNCHMIVLRVYSSFFMNSKVEDHIFLPDNIVTPRAFFLIYNWMLLPEPRVERCGILELYKAASYLGVDALAAQCWSCFDDDICFSEENAYKLYCESLHHKIIGVQELMFGRINRFFLTLVASQDFLDLSIDEVSKLLDSNLIGVNTEVEIFMSAVRWLNYNWEEREQYTVQLIRLVRFNLVAPWYLSTLKANAEFLEIERVVNNLQVEKIIENGILFHTFQTHFSSNARELLDTFQNYKINVPIQRYWVYDSKCPYHYRIGESIKYATYKEFLEYLKKLQMYGTGHWRTLELAAINKNVFENKKYVSSSGSSAAVNYQDV